MLGRDPDLLVVQRRELRGDAADAALGSDARRPRTATPRAITTCTGSVRQSIFETSPRRLSSIDSSRFVGAWRYFTSRPTSERERQADHREHPGVRGDEVVLPEEPVDGLEDEQPGQHGDGADDRDDDDVDVRMDRLAGRDLGQVRTGVAGPGDGRQGRRGVARTGRQPGPRAIGGAGRSRRERTRPGRGAGTRRRRAAGSSGPGDARSGRSLLDTGTRCAAGGGGRR